MHKLDFSLVAIVAVGLVGCSSPETGRPSASGNSEETGLTTADSNASAETGDSASTTASTTDASTTDASTTDASTTDASTTNSTDTGAKYDLAPIPDAPDCGGGGGGQMDAFSYIWLANSTQGTVSKIDTVSTIEEGRYTMTNDVAMQPSRTSVNQYGDVAVGHRFYPRVTKVAARIEHCVDKNNNGMIETSSGPNDILPYLEDECVLWSIDLPAEANGSRGVAWEGGTIDPDTCENTIPNPRLWIGYGGAPLKIYRLDGATGAVLDQTTVPSNGYVYGGAVNADGDFWVSDRAGRTLSRIDGVTLDVQVFPVPGSMAYGIGMDENGHPWFATYEAGAGDQIYRFDPDLQQFFSAGGGTGFYRGLNVDREGRVWAAGNAPCRLALFDHDTEMLVNDSIALPGCVDPVGVSVDRDGYVWVVDRGASVAWKVDPVFHLIVGTVNGLVNPYTYSDMTGQGLNLVINPPG